jgi:hypothetical protein
VWVRGHRNYGVEYVERLRNMVARHTSKPFEMVCLTDRPLDLPGDIRAIVPPDVSGFAWWQKVNLFHYDGMFPGRVLYLDLDVIVTGDLDPIIDYPAEFAISPCSAPGWLGKDGLVCVKGYNSSVMVWDSGKRRRFYLDWKPAVAKRLWSDQDWFKEISPNEEMLPAQWFERISLDMTPKPETKVVLAIKHKNHKAAKVLPWVREAWQ